MAIAGLVACVQLAPAAAGGAGHVVVTTAKHKEGPYAGGLVEANLAAGQRKSFYVRVRNDTSAEPVTALMTQDSPDGNGYKQRYFRNGQDITAAVRDGGLTLTLKQGRPKEFRLRIKRRVLSTSSFCSFTRVTETSPGAEIAFSVLSLNGDPCSG